MQNKIDAHSHFYKSYGGPNNDPQIYFENTKNLGVVAAIVSPGPCPEYHLHDSLYRPCRWKYSDGHFHYVEQICDSESLEVKIEQPAKPNPYHQINIRLLEDIQGKLSHQGPELFLMPLYHPLLDTDDEIRSFITHEKVVGIKLHGVATATCPDDVSSEIIKTLKETNKPLIVHTDNYIHPPTKPLHQTYVMNNPTRWVKWAIENQIKVLITHGARLSSTAINLAAKAKNSIVIGISPGILISTSDGDRLEKPSINFEKDIFTMVHPSQLVFDIDYGWNVLNRSNWEKKDWSMCDRIEALADELGISDQQLNEIYYHNAERFYNL